MSRLLRKLSPTGFYNITVRGAGRQTLFYEQADYYVFLDILLFYLKEQQCTALAWCLMSNHAHITLSDPHGNISKLMHKICLTYARYYNRIYDHVGPVFQGNFHSRPIADEAYLIYAVRYVHANPQRADICKIEDYKWSSYAEYLGPHHTVDPDPVLGTLGGREEFIKFSKIEATDHDRKLVGTPHMRLNDAELTREVEKYFTKETICNCKSLPAEIKEAVLHRIWYLGGTIRQAERLTGLGRYFITVQFRNFNLNNRD